MNGASVSTLDERRRRARRLTRVTAAHIRLREAVAGYEPAEASRGRAWINGREVGGTDPLFRHLTESHD